VVSGRLGSHGAEDNLVNGTGAVIDRMALRRGSDDALTIDGRSMAFLSISYDHRGVDGADTGLFLTAIKNRIETGFTPSDLT
jgi:2-oxoglutarate dehydrogenase E2 component (dihydrolipoamide succinyltransferase)